MESSEEIHIEDIQIQEEVDNIEEETTDKVLEEVVFDEPINFSEYDQFNLQVVLEQRRNAVRSGDVANLKNDATSKTSSKDIDADLNFEDDAEAIKQMEEFQRKLAEKKLQESVVDDETNLNTGDDDDEDESSEDEETIKKRKAEEIEEKSKPINDSWVNVRPIHENAYKRLKPKMAIQYPFELDKFQQQAVCRLERRDHVFVAAHTSAGKTVVAEYAIALAMKNNSRAVYTSPIKALSNQKYRDFKEKFGVEKVGIVTGDVSVNPKAQCLIMTTEIFRSMLYKGSDTVRDIEFVIFDEVHYVNDAERGVVWEEVIIMLPETITLIFLSATTSNAQEFSDWIGRTKRRVVHLISTNKRPVPLQHYLYYDDEVYRLMTGDKDYNGAAIAAARKDQEEKSKPKPKTAENAKMANDRQLEKAKIAAQAAGGINSVKGKQIMTAAMGGGGGRGGAGGRGAGSNSKGGSFQKSGPVGGSKGQWHSLIEILKNGGRAKPKGGGKKEIDFGNGVIKSRTVMSGADQEEKAKTQVPYEKLPKELKAQMTKEEYEKQEFRASESVDNELENSNEVGLLPVVVFSFSKKRCEELADFFKGKDFLTQKEKARVSALFTEVFSRLNPLDVDLPQINRLREMLLRGFGVHHGGLLPILKETVELLFTDSIVKVLFATETFAMGVNMPARAVIFNGFRKHDGREFRELLSGEYIQMAGRAGRRGLDQFGFVFLAAWSDIPADVTMRRLMLGSPRALSSQFRLRYNMILNLVRVNNLSIQEMIKRSFTEFASQKALSSQNLGGKLRKYEQLIRYYENEEIFYANPQEKEAIQAVLNAANQRRYHHHHHHGVSNPSFELQYRLIQEELERRRIYVEEMRKYVELFHSCQSIYFKQLEFVQEVISNNVNGNNKNKSNNSSNKGNKDGELINNYFSFGRLLQIQNKRTAAPVWAVVLVDPNASKTMAEELAAKKAPKKPMLVEVNAMAAARQQLMASNSLKSPPPSTSGKAESKDSKEKKDSDETFLWALALLTASDLPAWCKTSKPSSSPVIELSSLSEEYYGVSSISAYAVIKVSLKAIANSLSPALSELTAAIELDVSSGKRTILVDQVITEVILNTTVTSGGSDASGGGMVYTNFFREFNLTLKINIHSDTSSNNYFEQYDILSGKMADLQYYNALIAEQQQVYQQQVQQQEVLAAYSTASSAVSESTGMTVNLEKGFYQIFQLYPKLSKLFGFQMKVNKIKHYISDENMSLFPDFNNRLSVLRLLGYVENDPPVITKKGRVCCELNTCDELIGTEILFNNILEPLNPPEAAAILSALIFQEKASEEGGEDTQPLTSRMEVARNQLYEIVSNLNSLQYLEKVEDVPADDDENRMISPTTNKPILNFGLAAVVYQWARGVSFKDIMQITEFQEGSIVRTITRLDELCRDIQTAARAMGNQSLYYKMEAASACIKRDIVFAASLYIV